MLSATISSDATHLPEKDTSGDSYDRLKGDLWWRFPDWSMFDFSRTVHDPHSGHDVYIFWEDGAQLHPDQPATRYALYSTNKPEQRLYYVEDNEEYGAPPGRLGVPIEPDVLWPRPHPSWLVHQSKRLGMEPPHRTDTDLPCFKEIFELYGKTAMLYEIETLEALRANPHSNGPEYLGCVVQSGWVAGIALKRYRHTLHKAVSERLLSLSDVDSIMSQVESVVAHLHALGRAHNDISPWNIMFDQDKEGWHVVLLDFGGCAPFGQRIESGGTRGFSTQDWPRPWLSDMEHDTYSLNALRNWLVQQLTSSDRTTCCAFCSGLIDV